MICESHALNRHVTSPVVLDFDASDKLTELRLAVLQTQLEDLYQGVDLEVEQNVWGNKIRVSIWFHDPGDHTHFVLSQKCNQDNLPQWLLLVEQPSH